jgi:hypothetical protein
MQPERRMGAAQRGTGRSGGRTLISEFWAPSAWRALSAAQLAIASTFRRAGLPRLLPASLEWAGEAVFWWGRRVAEPDELVDPDRPQR